MMISKQRIMVFAAACLCAIVQLHGQVAADTVAHGLEAVEVERYFSAPAGTVPPQGYPLGATTYRIYIDLQEGYTLQAVFGDTKHELRFEGGSPFFNVGNGGAEVGNRINERSFATEPTAFDSWVSMGAATHLHVGVPLAEDSDGSLLSTYKQLAVADGLKAGEDIMGTIYAGSFISAFDANYEQTATIVCSNGMWGNWVGVSGFNRTENKILIAQLTTTGRFHFCLNIQIADKNGKKVQFVAKNPEAGQQVFSGLEQIIY